MAAQIAQDVVKDAQSMGASSIDTPVNSNDVSAGNGQPLTSQNPQSGDASEEPNLPTAKAYGEALSTSAGRYTPDTAIDDSAIADGSVGSDNEQGKSEGSGPVQENATGHVRTNSTAKRPVAFKSVSVTKSFLAKNPAATPSLPASSRASPVNPSGTLTSTLAAKPRLVAKSTLGNLSSRPSPQLNGVTGPDPNKVWNKNQPAPPPVPRQFTDEELKQQYGIHMATRLQADESSKEAKWADIDDDEEDWAPETVEWVDGTKSNVVANPIPSAPATPAAEPAVPPAIAKTDVAGPPKPLGGLTTPMSTSLSSKTILKPGALAANQAIQAKINKPSPLMGVKSPTDKPALIAKAAAPPSKSPWAVLPPVDKVPPVFPEPPSQHHGHMPFRRDPHGFDALQPPPMREMAADTFDRAWRPDGGRELYNSRSGNYEPVSDNRRGSFVRPGRDQPAVLRRPSQSDRSGAPEPSPAFQTSRYTGQDGRAQRRPSSNASASGARRLSIVRNMDERMSADNDSAVLDYNNMNGAPGPEGMAQSSGVQQNGPMQPAGPAQPSMEEQVAAQQKYIRDSRERARLAKQQREDAEKAEETARKERLRLKLESLAPPKAKETVPATDAGDAPITGMDQARPDQSAVSAPPRPPQPMGNGEVAQYGMMKVHQAHPVRKSPLMNRAGLAQSPELRKDQISPPISTQEIATTPNMSGSGLLGQNAAANRRDQSSQGNSPSNTNPWKSGPNQNQYNWSNNAAQNNTSISNVWGPPTQISQRGLGNGTFGSDTFNSVVGADVESPLTNTEALGPHGGIPQSQYPHSVANRQAETFNHTNRTPSGQNQRSVSNRQGPAYHQQQIVGLDSEKHFTNLPPGGHLPSNNNNNRTAMASNNANNAAMAPIGTSLSDSSPGQHMKYIDRDSRRYQDSDQSSRYPDARFGPRGQNNYGRNAPIALSHDVNSTRQPMPISSSTVTDMVASQAPLQPQVTLPGSQPQGFGYGQSAMTSENNQPNMQNGPYSSMQQQANIGQVRNPGYGNTTNNSQPAKPYGAPGQQPRGPYANPVGRPSRTAQGARPAGSIAAWNTFAANEPLKANKELEAFRNAGLMTTSTGAVAGPAANIGARVQPAKQLAPIGPPSQQNANPNATAVASSGTRAATHGQSTATAMVPSSSQQSNSAGVAPISRFFPAQKGAEIPKVAIAEPERDSIQPTANEALFGDITSIKVVLPKQKPAVKLPPAQSAVQKHQPTGRTTVPAQYSDVRNDPAYMASYKNGKASEVMATKTELSLPEIHQTVVSLPASPSRPTHASTASSKIVDSTTKLPTDELFEDRTFASLPIVRAPNKANYDHLPFVEISVSNQVPAVPVEVVSKNELDIVAQEQHNGIVTVVIAIPGSTKKAFAQISVKVNSGASTPGVRPYRQAPMYNKSRRGAYPNNGSPGHGEHSLAPRGNIRSASAMVPASNGSFENARGGRGRGRGGRGGFAKRTASAAVGGGT